jgi:hypothetical protein
MRHPDKQTGAVSSSCIVRDSVHQDTADRRTGGSTVVGDTVREGRGLARWRGCWGAGLTGDAMHSPARSDQRTTGWRRAFAHSDMSWRQS